MLKSNDIAQNFFVFTIMRYKSGLSRENGEKMRRKIERHRERTYVIISTSIVFLLRFFSFFLFSFSSFFLFFSFEMYQRSYNLAQPLIRLPQSARKQITLHMSDIYY
jgi:hypothetical protein